MYSQARVIVLDSFCLYSQASDCASLVHACTANQDCARLFACQYSQARVIVLVSLYLYNQAKVIVLVWYMHVQPVKSDCARLFACTAKQECLCLSHFTCTAKQKWLFESDTCMYSQSRVIVLDCLPVQPSKSACACLTLPVQPSKSDCSSLTHACTASQEWLC